MAKKKKGKVQECLKCRTVLPAVDFEGKSAICRDCEATGEFIHLPHYRMEANLKKLTEEIRYKNAKVIKHYKFEGEIPAPKDVSHYLPN